MNKPLQPPVTPDDDIGPLDENGQQIWSLEGEAAIARLNDDQAYLRSLEEADAQTDRGEWYTTEQVREHMAEVKRRWRAERGSL